MLGSPWQLLAPAPHHGLRARGPWPPVRLLGHCLLCEARGKPPKQKLATFTSQEPGDRCMVAGARAGLGFWNPSPALLARCPSATRSLRVINIQGTGRAEQWPHPGLAGGDSGPSLLPSFHVRGAPAPPDTALPAPKTPGREGPGHRGLSHGRGRTCCLWGAGARGGPTPHPCLPGHICAQHPGFAAVAGISLATLNLSPSASNAKSAGGRSTRLVGAGLRRHTSAASLACPSPPLPSTWVGGIWSPPGVRAPGCPSASSEGGAAPLWQ